VTRRAEDLLNAGITPAQILETLVAISIPLLASSVFQIAAVKLDGAFQPQVWTRAAQVSELGGKS